MGKSRVSIANTLRLLGLPPAILDSIERKELTEGHGRALLSIENEDAQRHVWSEVLAKKLSVRETEQRAQTLKRAGTERGLASHRDYVSRETSKPLDPTVAAALNAVQQTLGTKVSLRTSGAGGSIEIQFYSDEDLTRLLELLLEGAGV